MAMKKLNFNIKVTVTNQMCPKHHIPLVTYGKLKPFCTECQAEKINQEKINQVNSFKVNQIRGYLHDASLIDRQDAWNYTFSSFKASQGTPEAIAKAKAISLAKKYAEDTEKKFNSVFFGRAGTGKTHLAMAILNYVNEFSMQKCLFLSVPKLLDRNRKFVGDPTSSNWSKDFTIERVQEANLVVVDDLGAESAGGNASDFVQGVLFEIYESCQRIITTTNLGSKKIRSTYDNRMLSRIEENAMGNIIDFDKLRDKRPIPFDKG